MTLEPITYTDSALSDLFRNFFNQFKSDNKYCYVDQIDSNLIQKKPVVVDYEDFSSELKSAIDVTAPIRIKQAVYRSVGEVFQTRSGSAIKDQFQNEDQIRIQIMNCPKIDGNTFGNIKSQIPSEEPKISKGKSVIDETSTRIMNSHSFLTIRSTGEILTYNGKIYSKTDAESIIREETEKIIENCTEHERNEVINKIKARTYADIENFDANLSLTLEDCILDIATVEFRKHNPDHYSRILVPVQYVKPPRSINQNTIFDDLESNLKDTLFWNFLKSSFTVDDKFRKNDFETVLEITASFLVKKQIDEKAFIFLGRGENGKSVLLEYIESMLGKDNIERIQLQDLSDDKFMCANLAGKLANIFSDLEPDELKHAGKIKSIISNEGIEAQHKYKSAFKMYPFCKLMFSCNRFPKVFDQSQGFFRRWMIVKWERNFEGDPERDEHLKEKLRDNKEERNLVFSCLVHLARKLQKQGKFTHSKDSKTIQRMWNANADPIHDFATNYIVDSDNYKTKRETYHFYKEVMLSKGETSMGIGQFGKAFSEYFEESRETDENGRKVRVWQNIAFKIPKQMELNDFDSR